MNKAEARKRIEQLRKEIEHHRHLYHVLDRQEISDAAIDSLKHELVMLEDHFPELRTNDSPSQRIGGEPLDKFEKVTHEVRQWSLDDAFTRDDALQWEERNKRYLKQDNSSEYSMEYSVELKIDGLHVALTYRKGVLMTAATRGDGLVGENVTQNIKTIEAIPLRLQQPIDIFVEGEIYMRKNDFDALNKRREERGESVFANPRNASAGAIRQLDPKIAAERKLDCAVYDCKNASVPLPDKQYDKLEFLRELGFKVNPHYSKHDDLHSVFKAWKQWEERRDKENYWVDGIVVKINDVAVQERLGYTGKSPRWALALKFAPQEATTVVKDVIFNVGRTGKITPVAVFEPTLLHGTTVRHASLHNFDEITRLDVRIGDTVVIRKAGDIIPQVKQVLARLRPKNAKSIKPPKQCPSCGRPVRRRDSAEFARDSSGEQVDYVCVNQKCHTVFLEELAYFVGKSGLDMDGLGPKIMEQLVTAGVVAKRSDLFALRRDELLALERFAEKSVDNALESILQAKKPTLHALIRSLGISFVGHQTAGLVASYLDKTYGPIKTISKLLSVMEIVGAEELESIHGIGTRVARSVVNFFADKHNQKELARFEHLGMKLRQEKKNIDTTFANKTFVLTGTLKQLGRSQAKEEIEKRGGSVSSSVSKNTDYVVAGESAGSKLQKARKLGITTLNERDFLAMMN